MCMYIYSPGLGPGRVRSWTFCDYCTICYVCEKKLLHFLFCCNILCVCLATFTISAIVVVHCLDNCCLLFKKCAHEGGCQGAPGLIHNYLFHLLGAPFSHTTLYTTICSKKSDLRQNMYPKWCQNPLKIKLQIAILFCFVFL